MPTTQQVPAIVDKARARLDEAARESDIPLKVSGERPEDDGLYIVVVPTRPGVRASDHARFDGTDRRELREQGDDNVLLVPALDD